MCPGDLHAMNTRAREKVNIVCSFFLFILFVVIIIIIISRTLYCCKNKINVEKSLVRGMNIAIYRTEYRIVASFKTKLYS